MDGVKFDARDRLTFVHEPPAATLNRRDTTSLAAPIVLPKVTARQPPVSSTPWVLPPAPIEAPPVPLGAHYSLDAQDITWLQQENASRVGRNEEPISTGTLEEHITSSEEYMHQNNQSRFPSPPRPSRGTALQSVHHYWRRKRSRRESDLHPLGSPCVEELTLQPQEVHSDLPFTIRSGIPHWRWVKHTVDVRGHDDAEILVHLKGELDVMCDTLQMLVEREALKTTATRMDTYLLAYARECALTKTGGEHVAADDATGVFHFDDVPPTMALQKLAERN